MLKILKRYLYYTEHRAMLVAVGLTIALIVFAYQRGQENYQLCCDYADKHGGHVESYITSMSEGTSYHSTRVSLPNGSYITADEIRRISGRR